MSSTFLTKLPVSKTYARPTMLLLFPPHASSQVLLNKRHFMVESRLFQWNYVRWLSSKTPAEPPNSKVRYCQTSSLLHLIHMNLGKPSTQLRSKRKTIVDDSSSDNAPTEETSASKRQKKTHEEV
jgi:hypothetical protein